MVLKQITIGVFDSGIGGYSVLRELFSVFPEATYYYYSDDKYAPYGPKSDEFISERSIVITEELMSKGADIVVVACNTATAASIEVLRQKFPQMVFVGIEPYLNAYYKFNTPTKMAVITTVSTGKSERFKKLTDRLDPQHHIDAYTCVNLAKLVEDYYYQRISKDYLLEKMHEDLKALENQSYTHLILGCTHYPLVRNYIEEILNLKTLSPCPFVARRVKELANNLIPFQENPSSMYYLYSSNNPQWQEKSRENFLATLKE